MFLIRSSLIAIMIGFCAVSTVSAITIDKFVTVLETGQVKAGTEQSMGVISGSPISIVGGSRAVRVTADAAPGTPYYLDIKIKDGYFDMQSGFGGSGTVLLVWDGSTDASKINYTGLGGIDLLSVEATKFQTKLSFDYANDVSANLRVTVYDALDPTGSKKSVLFKQLTKEYDTDDVEFPFSDFVPENGGADFSRVGAITIEFITQSAHDIVLHSLTTDGDCDTTVPLDGNTEIVDVCGFCYGTDDYGTEALDKSGECCPLEELDSDSGICGEECIEVAATSTEKRKARRVIRKARILHNRTGRFAGEEQKCNGIYRDRLVARSDHFFAEIKKALTENITNTILRCTPSSICTEAGTRATKTRLRQLTKRIYRVAKKSKLNAISACNITDTRHDGRKVTEDYRDDVLKTIKNLPKVNEQCD